jgi:hypothetical protein
MTGHKASLALNSVNGFFDWILTKSRIFASEPARRLRGWCCDDLRISSSAARLNVDVDALLGMTRAARWRASRRNPWPAPNLPPRVRQATSLETASVQLAELLVSVCFVAFLADRLSSGTGISIGSHLTDWRRMNGHLVTPRTGAAIPCVAAKTCERNGA